MAKELNSEFDIQARAQKHFEESVAKKVENHQALNDKELEYLCPVAFKSTMTQNEISKLYVKTSRELKIIFKLERTIIKKLEILVFCIPK